MRSIGCSPRRQLFGLPALCGSRRPPGVRPSTAQDERRRRAHVPDERGLGHRLLPASQPQSIRSALGVRDGEVEHAKAREVVEEVRALAGLGVHSGSDDSTMTRAAGDLVPAGPGCRARGRLEPQRPKPISRYGRPAATRARLSPRSRAAIAGVCAASKRLRLDVDDVLRSRVRPLPSAASDADEPAGRSAIRPCRSRPSRVETTSGRTCRKPEPRRLRAASGRVSGELDLDRRPERACSQRQQQLRTDGHERAARSQTRSGAKSRTRGPRAAECRARAGRDSAIEGRGQHSAALPSASAVRQLGADEVLGLVHRVVRRRAAPC